MNFGDLITYFRGTLNRNDVTPSLVTSWIQESIRRAQRLLDVPSSERTLQALAVDFPTTSLPIPSDFQKLIAISYNGVDLINVEPSRVRSMPQIAGQPRYYARVQNVWFISPACPVGDTLEINYQADFSVLVEPTDANWLTYRASQMIVDGAMSLACRYFSDPRMANYEQSFTQAIGDLNNEAAMDELNNAVISPGIDFHQGGKTSRYHWCR